MKRFALFATLGGLGAYFFDPQNGKRRRRMTVDRTAGFFRRRGRRVARAGRAVAAETYGAAMKVRHLSERDKDLNDATLAQKVETTIFRDPEIPKGNINVNAEDGVVYLRGEVETPDLIEQLGKAARDVKGVRDVENLLHLPKTPPQRKK